MRSNDGEGEPGKGLNAMFNFLNKKDRTPPVLPEGTVRRRYTITGQVQGVQGDPDKFLTLFAMIQKSDYIQITGIRQKDIPSDPWERGFSVKGY